MHLADARTHLIHEAHNKIVQEEKCYLGVKGGGEERGIYLNSRYVSRWRERLLYLQARKLRLLPEDRTFKSGAGKNSFPFV